MRTLAQRRAELDMAGEADSEGSWAISYGDMITLLLTFFIIFFNTSRTNENSKAIQDVMLKTLSSKLKNSDSASANTRSVSAVALGVKQEGISIEENIIKTLGVKIEKVGSKLILDFQEVSFYNFGKTEVTPEGSKALTEFVEAYLPFAGSNQLGIRAYTDDKPVVRLPNRRFSDNLELSALRSVSAMRILQNAGLPLDRMKIGGYGELRLTADELEKARGLAGPTARGLPLARKVVLVIEPETKDHL